jgi:hypothetical protein
MPLILARAAAKPQADAQRGLSRFLWQEATKMGLSPLPTQRRKIAGALAGTAPKLYFSNQLRIQSSSELLT